MLDGGGNHLMDDELWEEIDNLKAKVARHYRNMAWITGILVGHILLTVAVILRQNGWL
jgi:hypothetical protein